MTGLVRIPVEAALPYKSAIKDARVLLRNALPINNPTMRDLQLSLEKMPRQANLKQWGSLRKQVEELSNLVGQNLGNDQGKILAAVTDLSQGKQILGELAESLQPLQVAIANKERNKIKPLSEQALEWVGALEALMVQRFPFEIPPQYADLPQLRGRATVELETSKGKLNLVLDGYNAPITAGQFADLVQRGFYDHMEFGRADDNYFLQAGDPPGDADGFIDPVTGKLRKIPMEVKVPDQVLPIYGKTFAQMGTYGVIPVLPFSAYGTLAMAHPDADPNGGSSQFFIYLFESDLTPAGLNLLDGNFAAFGYVLDGQPVLDKMKLGDQIISAKITSGLENLVLPTI
ncbi:MAG: peptidylprolyl isomerase [Pseudanabaenaceae cyanobacterium bins.68]|nr:peptidylprolyl isomerase [Pseudanabaenaceae cyanobacterium bins.68]